MYAMKGVVFVNLSSAQNWLAGVTSLTSTMRHRSSYNNNLDNICNN